MYLLPIETHIGKDHAISDDWKKAVFQTSIQMVKELAIAVHKFYTQYPDDKKVSPLFISAQQGNLQLTQYLIGKGTIAVLVDFCLKTPKVDFSHFLVLLWPNL